MFATDDVQSKIQRTTADLAAYGTSHSIVSVRFDDKSVTLGWSDGLDSRFHVLWLRDNCACSECRHPLALERTYMFIDHSAPVVASARLDSNGDVEVTFRQERVGHVSRYEQGWLRAHDPAESSIRGAEHAARPWDDNIADRLVTVEYDRYMQDPAEGLRPWIAALKTDGIVLLRGVPTVSRQLLEVAKRIGPVRASNFGEYYDVISMAEPNASAYTAMGLELHTDLANWRFPPDIQLLFCLASDVTGGESVFGDGLRAAEDLRALDPPAFHLLTTQPVEYRFHDRSCDIRSVATIIEVDRGGNLQRIRFNNWLRGTTVFPEKVVESMYAAMGTFWRMLREPKYQLKLRLRPGDLITYDNHRVLHGRAPFDAASGQRHLQGCYINQEDLDSRLRLLDRPA